MKNLIKTILICLLLSCFIDGLSYGYFTLIRFIATAGFIWLFFIHDTEEKYVYVFLAILFQPLLKIHLGKDIWQIVDGIVPMFLGASIILNKNNK